ncbi:hypothetical protein JTB14_031053 [Gonioctena quinquepunctata]|nr:hypothetical protein JTB14_031053 [Gonioctena quinquepunctata]
MTAHFMANALRRRSKSVTDLRSHLDIPLRDKFPKAKFNFPSAAKPQSSSCVKGPSKRPAGGKSEDETKAKMVKQAKIPDWDYKSRFQNLNERHTNLLETLKNLKAKTAEWEGLDERHNTLQIQYDELERQNLEMSNSNKNLMTDNDNVKKINLDVTNKLHILTSELQDLKIKHTALVLKEQELVTELKKLAHIEKDFHELKMVHRDLQVGSDLLKNEVDEMKVKNEGLEKSLNDETEECDNLKKTVIILKQDVLNLKQDVVNGEFLRRQLHNIIQDLKGNIRVFCRVRPPVSEEELNKMQCLITIPDENTLEIRKTKENINVCTGKALDGKAEFSFDQVFHPEATQAEFFEELAHLVQSALDGYDVCVFAYGQTGSGKTYTMQGSDSPEHHGMIPRAIETIFESIDKLARSGWVYEVKVSFMEIYNEAVRDLLDPDVNRSSLDIMYNEGRGITVSNLSIRQIHSLQEFQELMKVAQKHRMVATTNFNEHSSRSHAIYKIYLYGSNERAKCSYLGSVNLVDLAGSERATDNIGDRLAETRSINSSLSALGNVMMALYNKDKHIPYRNSKLTYLLQSSLGGSSKTLMIVNIPPFEDYYQETLTSLRFAAKVKQVKTVVKKNKALLTPQLPVYKITINKIGTQGLKTVLVMHFRIQTLLCWAVLIGFATAAQNNQRSSSSDLTFREEDSAIEGSGYNGEVTHDLESSGSGFGPDDEDDPDLEKPRTTFNNNNPPVFDAVPKRLPDDLDIDKDIAKETQEVPETTPDTSVRMNPKPDDRPTSFFAQPGILAAVIGGAVVGLLCAILVVMFIVYRMRKKDEGSYALGEPKQSPNSNSYSRATTNKEFYA